MAALRDLTDDDAKELPLDALALIVLEHLARTDQWNSHNFLNDFMNSGRSEFFVACLSEALNWLVSHGLVCRDAPFRTSSAQSIFISRSGKRALDEGLFETFAIACLGVDLNERLDRCRSQFLIGEYELAVFTALREVEIRVRELSGAPEALLGTKLTQEAFKDGGALADSSLEGGERVGLMNLFAGAIGTFKNPPSHRQVNYSDATEASEVVLLADLLLRLLERQPSGK